jgi:hypothetical protein
LLEFPEKTYGRFRLNEPEFSIANPQQVFPLTEIAFEPHAPGDLKG